MVLPESFSSYAGNAIATLAEIVGTISGDKKIMVKRSSISTNETLQRHEDLSQSNDGGGSQEAKRSNCETHQNSNENIYENPDIYLTVPELIKKYNYPFECHNVLTKDSYILSVFRIPQGRMHIDEDRRPPVLLAHGLLNSAGAWVMNETDKALAFMLADKGYDCWMLNSRGCTYSKEHQTFSACDKEFWNFSFHEMGTMDVPAVIDYILEQTSFSKLYYIGHSLGSTQLMIAANEDEKIVEKIKLFICLAPAVYLYKTTAKLLSYNAPFFRQQKAILDYFTGHGELMNKTFVQQFKAFSHILPSPEHIAAKCVTTSMYTMGGYNPDQIHWPRIPVIAGHTPSSSSVLTYIHCLQYFNNSQFQQYDYGSVEENIKVYGRETPPKYDLAKVTCPTILFYGENDLLCRPEAVLQLSDELPNVLGCYKVDCEKFSHTDFLYAKDVDTLVYNNVIQLLEQYQL